MSSPSPAPLASPEAAVASYFRAGDEHASRHVRAAFLPDTPIRWVDADGTPRALEQVEWWPRLDGSRESPATSRVQRTLDRDGTFALVEAVSRWPDHGFHDLLLAVDTPDGWRLAGKVFARLGPGEAAAATADPAAEVRAIRDVLDVKIAAHAAYDPELLRASHLADCRYAYLIDGTLRLSTLSEAAARYAANQDAGITDHGTRGRIVFVEVRGTIAAAKLEVPWEGRRNIDHLLLVKTAGGWKIAAAAWGPAEA